MGGAVRVGRGHTPIDGPHAWGGGGTLVGGAPPVGRAPSSRGRLIHCRMLEPVIGLEIHLAIRTRSKMFCGCPTEGFGMPPNTHVCPVCMGLPGSLPVTNRDAIEKAVMFALALGCTVPERTQFHRKHYFYPDAPKNYQISQYDRPVGSGGTVTLSDGARIGITRCHVEEDAGRSVHPPYGDHSLVDLNRAGAPLIEMVTEPDLRTPEQARDFLAKIRAIARALGISDASPEEGKMRADVNVSLRTPGAPLGTKVEVKNLNSFKSVQAALEAEVRRQTAAIEDGFDIVQETRGWNEGGQKTYLLRTKEEAADYRYFPDPDLPVMHIPSDWQEEIRGRTPELPDAKAARYLAAGVRTADAEQIAYDVGTARFFDDTMAAYAGEPQAIANWLVSEVAGELNARETRLDDVELTPQNLAALVALVDAGTISGKIAKDILPEVVDGADPRAVVERRNLRQITDAGALVTLVDGVLDAHPDVVASARENPKAINALLGRVMQASRGKANPEAVREILEEKLSVAG